MKFLQQTLNTKYGGNIFVTPGLNGLRPKARGRGTWDQGLLHSETFSQETKR